MRKTLMTSFLLLACSLVLAAQSQDQPQPYQQDPSSSSQMGKNVTLTGCLAPGKDPNTYVLRNVTQSGMNQSSENQSQSPDQYEPSELAKTETSYALIPEGRVDLKSHLGHKVEVTGKVIEPSDTSSGKSSMTHSSTEATGQSEFKVSSIRHISNTCQ